MRSSKGPLPALVGGALVAAVLVTLLVEGGWLIWLPTLLALAILACLAGTVSR